MKYKISIATYKDTHEIMSFINAYWRKGHLLATNKMVFEFQYRNKLDPNYLNLVIAKNANHEVKAILGYIPIKYDCVDSDVFGALWKVADDVNAPMLGLKLLNFLKKHIRGNYLTLGLNETSSSIYRMMGFNVGHMKQWYIGNNQCKEVLSKNIENVEDIKLSNLYELKNIDLNTEALSLLKVSGYPQKDEAYIQHRFIRHPVYDYEFLGVFKDNTILGVFIIREQRAKNTKCIRIVEFFGDDQVIAGSAYALKQLIVTRQAEYVDFIVSGLDEKIMSTSGFLEPNDNVIIPNHFEPFVLSNVHVMYAYEKVEHNKVLIFKADGDQDRPNMIEHKNE